MRQFILRGANTKMFGWEERPKNDKVYTLEELSEMCNVDASFMEKLIENWGDAPDAGIWEEVFEPNLSFIKRIERLEAFAQSQGMKEKDIWEGVEFAHFKYPKHNQFPFFKIKDNGVYLLTGESDNQAHKNNCEPITEKTYFEQLKKEAFDKYGEIKEGDRFETADGYNIPIDFNGYSNNLIYIKSNDSLNIGGCKIYQAGKWAKKLPKRVEVKCIDHDYEQGNYYADKFALRFESKNLGERDYDEIGQFLAKQLESYLNNEI